MSNTENLFVNTHVFFFDYLKQFNKGKITAIQLKHYKVFDKSKVVWLTCNEHTSKLTFYKTRFGQRWVWYSNCSNF